MPPVLDQWQQGDKSAAVKRFTEVDWRSGPLFPGSSPLSWSEEQFKQLPASDRDAKFQQINSETGTLKQLTAAVVQAGLDAAARNDKAQARKHFTSLQQFGEVLDSPDSLGLLV